MALRQGMNNMTSRASLWLTFPLGDRSRPPLRSIPTLLLLLLLSHFSRVRLCVTPWMSAHQASLSLGFFRQENWNGLPFPSPTHACMLSRFSHVWLCNPIDGSPPGFSVHRILQARILEWVSISFSKWHFPPRNLTQVSCIAGKSTLIDLEYFNCLTQ